MKIIMRILRGERAKDAFQEERITKRNEFLILDLRLKTTSKPKLHDDRRKRVQGEG
jgi:hypothetical protein